MALNVYFHNVGGLRTKLRTIQQNGLCSAYDIILVESWLNPDIANIFKYDRNPKSSEKQRGGGILIIIRKELTAEQITLLQVVCTIFCIY